MAQQIINVGAADNDGTGDKLRPMGQKVNANFTELYAAIAAAVTFTGEDARDTIGTALVAGRNITITVNDVGDTITIAAGADEAFIRLDADYPLTSATTAQKIFDTTANGRLTLTTGVYRIRGAMMLTGMSATSGNADFNVLGAGTATLAGQMIQTIGRDANPNVAGAASSGTMIVAQNNVGADSVAPGGGTGMQLAVDGMFKCTVAGTIIPSLALTTAAAAAVKAGSFLEVRKIAELGTNYAGAWA